MYDSLSHLVVMLVAYGCAVLCWVCRSIAEEQARAEALRARIAAVTGGGRQAVTEQDRAKVAAAHKKYRSAWRDRKAKVSSSVGVEQQR
jgi:hypothetical protein